MAYTSKAQKKTSQAKSLLYKIITTSTITALLSACAHQQVASPRSTSIYGTTGFGETKQDASRHAVENARTTCGKLPVTIISDMVDELQYQDKTTTIYEVNLRYRCGNPPQTNVPPLPAS